MSDRTVKVPHGLQPDAHTQRLLQVQGITLIESCTRTREKKGSMFLEDHLVLFVLEGVYNVQVGGRTHTVRKNEMVLLQKAIAVQYEKTGEPDREYTLEYMMFFMKDELLQDFIRMSRLSFTRPSEPAPVLIHPANERLQAYVASLKPYFREPGKVEESLIRIKLLELLFDIASEQEAMMRQLLQLNRQARAELPKIVEDNLLNPVSIADLAYLSGRSVSSFKRDFQSVYHMPPAKWIKRRRLEKAAEMLAATGMSVTDVCFAAGFENVAHFSKAFKDCFGYPPSAHKRQPGEPNEQTG